MDTGLGPNLGLVGLIEGFNFASALAAILMASLIGIFFYSVVVLLEYWLMPWQRARQGAA